jgi:hypothetical protein
LRRLKLILAGLALGGATGLGAWFAAGGASAQADRLEPVAEKLQATRPPRFSDPAAIPVDVTELASAPLFPLSVGPGAVQDPIIQLEGVSLTPTHRAALVVIDAQPAEWVQAGETRASVKVLSVERSAVVLDTLLGVRRVELGALPPQSAPAGPVVAPARAEAVPRGYRLPPPPANAPR